METFVVVYLANYASAKTTRTAVFTAETQADAETFGRDYVKSISRIERGSAMTYQEVRGIR